MSGWTTQTVNLRFGVSDLTLWTVGLPMSVRSISLGEAAEPVSTLTPPEGEIPPNSAGFMIRGLPVLKEQPVVTVLSECIAYVQRHYRHCYIDMRCSFEEYSAKFSSKTRSTIARKVRKFREHCGGELRWVSYSSPSELLEFHRVARTVSALTYQERLLDAGLPNTSEFVESMQALAAQDSVRAFVLFDGERPVSYLYCPVHEEVLVYAYLGYDPAYMKWSVGTILQWLALERLFAERRFRYFDFTEGESEHKRLFATHDQASVNVLYLRRTVKNRMLVHALSGFDRYVEAIGEWLESRDLKRRVRRLIRFGSTS